jgi:hypothetical protein
MPHHSLQSVLSNICCQSLSINNTTAPFIILTLTKSFSLSLSFYFTSYFHPSLVHSLITRTVRVTKKEELYEANPKLVHSQITEAEMWWQYMPSCALIKNGQNSVNLIPKTVVYETIEIRWFNFSNWVCPSITLAYCSTQFFMRKTLVYLNIARPWCRTSIC